jgi:DNA-binding PucR family transcriptional regulator
MTSVVGVLRGQRNRLEHCDYDLSLEHVALILSGREVRFELSELARRAGARMLKMAVAADMTWAWIGYPPGTAQRQLAGLTRLLESAAESTAIGEPTVGIAGFRLSHEQAAQAAHFQREGARVTRYGDIALLTVLDSDKVKQAAFVRYELAQLAEAGHRLEVLRETLRVYLQNGQNITATQAVCGISRGTVRRRLAAVEETLGRTIMTHAASLLVALTLVDTGCLDEGGG